MADEALSSPHPRAAAFFDVDNTMLVGASIFHFAKGMAARNFFTWRDLVRFTLRQTRLRVRGENHGDMHTARDSALAFVAGKKVDEIVALGEEIYDEEMADKIWSGTYALAMQHIKSGQRVWLVTATPVELATIIARRLKLTGALGTIAQSQDGVYTGRLVGDVLHGEAKAHAVSALAAREGLDLSQCTAYSDSINDIPMLSLVGTAVAVNPDSALRAEAKHRGWQIRDFRSGRKVARVSVGAALGLSALAGGVAAGLAVRRGRTPSTAPRRPLRPAPAPGRFTRPAKASPRGRWPAQRQTDRRWTSSR